MFAQTGHFCQDLLASKKLLEKKHKNTISRDANNSAILFVQNKQKTQKKSSKENEIHNKTNENHKIRAKYVRSARLSAIICTPRGRTELPLPLLAKLHAPGSLFSLSAVSVLRRRRRPDDALDLTHARGSSWADTRARVFSSCKKSWMVDWMGSRGRVARRRGRSISRL